MMDLIATASPRQLARTAGGLYLANIVLGFLAIGVGSMIQQARE